MTFYEIQYIRTGSGERKLYDRVMLSDRDEITNGKKTIKIHSIIDAIEAFEILAENWGTYESKNAIVNIKVTER